MQAASSAVDQEFALPLGGLQRLAVHCRRVLSQSCSPQHKLVPLRLPSGNLLCPAGACRHARECSDWGQPQQQGPLKRHRQLCPWPPSAGGPAERDSHPAACCSRCANHISTYTVEFATVHVCSFPCLLPVQSIWLPAAQHEGRAGCSEPAALKASVSLLLPVPH